MLWARVTSTGLYLPRHDYTPPSYILVYYPAIFALESMELQRVSTRRLEVLSTPRSVHHLSAHFFGYFFAFPAPHLFGHFRSALLSS